MMFEIAYYVIVLGIPFTLMAGIAWAMSRGKTPWLRP
jgi:hypothetical protein